MLNNVRLALTSEEFEHRGDVIILVTDAITLTQWGRWTVGGWGERMGNQLETVTEP